MDKRVLAVSGDVENLPVLYENLAGRFPEERLHSYKQFDYLLRETDYKLIMLEREETGERIAYGVAYPVMGTGVIWLDYLTVLEKYQGQGYGQILFAVLMNHYREHGDTFLFMVEPDGPRRSVQFFEKQGARCLPTCFFLPMPDGTGKEMNLLFRPFSKGYFLTARKQRDTLKSVYSLLLHDVDRPLRKKCEQRTVQTITDESV